MVKLLLFISVLSFVISCTETKKTSLQHTPDRTEQDKLLKSKELLIVNYQGEPVSGAKILIGLRQGEPFRDNLITTNQDGIAIIPSQWQNDQALSIIADGYINTTYLKQSPKSKTYIIRSRQEKPELEVTGSSINFGDTPKDGFVDFGLVLPMLTKGNYFNFNLNMFISPKHDEIEIAGRKMTVPSNISFPDQEERYLIFNLHFNKPEYRSYFDEAGHYQLISSHGKFPVKKVIKAFRRGDTFTDVMNLFEFLDLGFTEADVLGPIANVEISVKQETYEEAITVSAPSIPEGFSYFAAVLNEKENLLYPSDIKRLLTGESILLKQNPQSIFHYALGAIAKEVPGEQGITSLDPATSISIMPALSNNQFEHLPLVAKPNIQAQKALLEKPQSSLLEGSTYLSLSNVSEITDGNQVLEHKDKIWEIYASGWVDQIDLPKLPDATQRAAKLYWEVAFTSSLEGEKVAGPELFEMAEFISRNAVGN